MANRQTQGQREPAKRNPGDYLPDEDDVQREKQSTTVDQRKGTRNAQEDTPGEVADERVDDDADIGDDEDEEDGSGGHI